MRNSGGGAQEVRGLSKVAASVPLPNLIGKRKLPASVRRRGSQHELALRKQENPRGWSCSIAPPPPPGTRNSARTPAPPASTEGDRWSAPGNSAPASARSALLALRRQRHCNWRCDVPCWLVSLLLHLLAVVTLGSLTIPVGRHRSVISMLITFGELGTSADNAPVELIATASLVPDEPSAGSALDPAADHAEDLHAHQAPIDIALPSNPALGSKTQSAAESPGATWSAEALEHRTPSNSQGEARLANHIEDAHEEAHDEVVDRFIEFDVGRLTGQPGALAKRDFDRLGPNAIRSLIRGLNKSASIHASCPVMVISNKIEAVLRESNSPSMLRYALDNIGRDVPENAPHFSRLQGLLASLSQSQPGMSSPNLSMLASLKSFERSRVLAAIQRAVDVRDTLDDEEKREAARSLIRLISHRDSKLRGAAHDALVAMADGKDFGPANDRRSADRTTAARAWSLHFDPERYQNAARSMLNNARQLADAGRRDAARKQLRKLLHEYPNSVAAGEAADQLDALKLSAIK